MGILGLKAEEDVKKHIQSVLNALLRLLKLDEASVFEFERRREEAYLADSADIYELEARQRAWQQRNTPSFPA